MLETFRDVARFFAQRKKFVLIPLCVTLLLLGTLMVLAQGSAMAPFIYAVF